MMKELKNSEQSTASVLPAPRSADANGSGVDVSGAVATGLHVSIGAPGITLDGSNYIAFELEESDDNSTFTDVNDKNLVGATGAGGGEFYRADAAGKASLSVIAGAYVGGKKYIRIVENFVGTHGTGTVAGASVVTKQRHVGGAAA